MKLESKKETATSGIIWRGAWGGRSDQISKAGSGWLKPVSRRVFATCEDQRPHI